MIMSYSFRYRWVCSQSDCPWLERFENISEPVSPFYVHIGYTPLHTQNCSAFQPISHPHELCLIDNPQDNFTVMRLPVQKRSYRNMLNYRDRHGSSLTETSEGWSTVTTVTKLCYLILESGTVLGQMIVSFNH